MERRFIQVKELRKIVNELTPYFPCKTEFIDIFYIEDSLSVNIVDVNKSEADFDDFYGNDNLQDVLNTQFEVGNRLVTLLRRGDLFANHYQVTSDATLTPFIERFSNVLAGYELEVTIEMKNDISIC